MQDFPKKLPEKLRLIRERMGLSPDAFAFRVGAKDGEAIKSYEDDNGDVPISILFAYVKLSGLTIEHFLDDNLDLGFWTFAP